MCRAAAADANIADIDDYNVQSLEYSDGKVKSTIVVPNPHLIHARALL